VVAEVVLFDYWQGLLGHEIAKDGLRQAGYTEQQAVRMLRRVSRLVDKR
jgi:hypothetical protein